MSYSVTMIVGLAPSIHRGIAFLESTTDTRIDGRKVFDGLKQKTQRDVLARFDYWLTGNTFDKYFHGWPNLEKYKKCFVFKWKAAGTNHRLYGALENPKPLTTPGFQVCILILHDQKTDETDFSKLDYINGLRSNLEVNKAVKTAFPDRLK